MSIGGRVELSEGRGRRAAGPRIRQPFQGTLRGLYFNGLHLLEAAAEGDGRLTSLGSVSRLRERESGPRPRVLPDDADDEDGDPYKRMMSAVSPSSFHPQEQWCEAFQTKLNGSFYWARAPLVAMLANTLQGWAQQMEPHRVASQSVASVAPIDPLKTELHVSNPVIIWQSFRP